LFLLASCGSSTQTVTAPQPVKCGLQLQADSSAFSAAGGTGTLRVSASRECVWSARSDAAWLSLAVPVEGQGDGTLKFDVAANNEPAARTGGVTVNDQRLSVSQQGRPCEFRLSSTREQVEAAGGDRTLEVRASSGQCDWTARAEVPWIAITGGSRGTGTGSVTFRVDAVSGPPRTGTLTVAGQVVSVEQGTGCTFSLGATSFVAPASGATVDVAVSAPPGCAWTAVSHVPWIAITAGATGSGSGVVGLRVGATEGPSRTGTLTIAGRSVTVEQSRGCSYVVGPSTRSVPASGGSGVVSVQTAAGCPWSAASTADWITIASGANGVGPGDVQFTVVASNGPARTGAIRIGDQTVTINQGSGCAVSTDPSSLPVPASGGTSAVQVTSAAGCPWSASSNAPWVTITGGSSGSGNGQVQLAIAANSGPARQASLTIGGRAFLVSQANGCTYDVAPRSHDVGGLGGPAAVSIATGAACPWSASSNADWLTLSATAGAGPGQVQLIVAANSGPPRAGTATVAGLPVTVSQASPCTFVLVPPLLTYDSRGGNGAVLVIVTGGCTWTAASTVDWITMTSGTSGSGDGVVQFTVAPNPGQSRTGIVAIAGQSYTVTQSGR
jgi:hypothetical protein